MLRLGFDIDGVLNNTPARGSRGFGVDADKVQRLWGLAQCLLLEPSQLVCVSYWRNTAAMRADVKLPFPFTWAIPGNKSASIDGLTLVLDDQPDQYLPTQPIYKVNGRVGLTQADVGFIIDRLHTLRPTW